MPDRGVDLAVGDAVAALNTQALSRHVVLDAEFGTGKRFLLFLAQWHSGKKSSAQLHYIAYTSDYVFPEAFNEDATVPRPVIEGLRAQWPIGVPGLHRVELCSGRVVLTLCFGESDDCLRRLRTRVDCILADFASGKPAERAAWMSRAFARVAKTGASLHFFLNAGHRVDSSLSAFIQKFESSGFRGEFHKAHAHSGAEWRGRFVAGREHHLTRNGLDAKLNANLDRTFMDQRALVIGSGLAGTAAARSLAKRGWKVLIFDQCADAAQRASGNLAAVITPMLSRDDGLASRLSRASFLQLLNEIRELNSTSALVRWGQCGVVQLAEGDAQESAFRELLRLHQYPSDYVRYLNSAEVARISGAMGSDRGALFFPKAGWVNPPSLCEARIMTSGVQTFFNETVCGLIRCDGGWQLVGGDAQVIAEAPVVVLANGYEATRFTQAQHLRLKKVRGQVTHVPVDALPSISTVICGDGYLTPELDRIYSVGATYDFGVEEGSVLESCNQQNLDRLQRLIPGPLIPKLPAVLGGRVGFRSLTADRMPMIGRLADTSMLHAQKKLAEQLDDIPRLQGLFTCLGMGSRGGVWSGMAGEILASLIEGEPPPIEGDLLDAIDPARFILREARRASASNV